MLALARIIALAVVCVHLFAQSPEHLKFEEASIRKTDPAAKPGPPLDISPAGRLKAVSNLKFLLTLAYSVQDFRIIGAPKWLETDSFTISAVPPPGTEPTGQTANNERTMERLRSLFEDRFQLKAHRETRELPIYQLVIAKGGAKLKELPQAKPGEFKLSLGSGRILTRGGGARIPMLANLLMNQLERTVVDSTGLTGFYAIDLTYAPDDSKPGDRPSLFTALQEQLGLKLEAKKGPVEVLVIDSVERPSENE